MHNDFKLLLLDSADKQASDKGSTLVRIDRLSSVPCAARRRAVVTLIALAIKTVSSSRRERKFGIAARYDNPVEEKLWFTEKASSCNARCAVNVNATSSENWDEFTDKLVRVGMRDAFSNSSRVI